MKRLISVLLVSFCVLVLAGSVSAQKTVALNNSPQLFALEDIRPGMKGTARTVFSGTEAEEFGVEVLGVLPGFPGPRQSAIIARLSGSNVDKTGVFAGMSGSPVFIDGKLVGAIAFSFPFRKEPIAGITPIKQMIDLFNKGRRTRTNQKNHVLFRFRSWLRLSRKPNFPKPAVSSVSLFAPVSAGSPLMPLLGQQMTPIATPLVFNGISQDTLAMFSPQLMASGMLPVSGAGGSAAITPLSPVDGKTLPAGSSISVQLVRGDYSLAHPGRCST